MLSVLWPKPTVEAGRATHKPPRPSAGQSAKKKGSTLRRDGYAGCCPSALARRKGGLWSPADQRKRGPHRPSALFSFLVPSCSARPRPACDRADEASSCSAIGGRQRNAAAIRQSQSRMSDRQQQRSFPFPHACPLRLVGHACPLPQGTWVASCQDGRGRSAGSSRSGLAGSAMAVLIAD